MPPRTSQRQQKGPAGAAYLADAPDALTVPLELKEDVLDQVPSWKESELIGQAMLFVAQNDLAKVAVLLDTVVLGAQHDKCTRGLAHIILEEVFSALPRDHLGDMWQYMDSRKEVLTSNLEGTKPPGTTLLRIANSILRKLSVANDTEFIANIHLYLASAFGPYERTALNNQGNTYERSTIFPDEPDNDDYRTYWAIQKDFANPAKLLEPGRVPKLLDGIEAIISMYFDMPSDFPIPKSLLWNTSPALFEDQINDKVTRRILSLEILVLFEFLLQYTAENKEAVAAKTGNKAALGDYVLDEKNKARVLSFKARWFNVLKDTCTSAQLRTIGSLMKNERIWTQWKFENLPRFLKRATITGLLEDKDERLAALIKPRARFEHSMGSAQLSSLWEVPTGLEHYKTAGKGPGRPQLTIQQVYDDLKDLDEPEAVQSYTWMGYRTAIASSEWSNLKMVTPDAGLGALLGIFPDLLANDNDASDNNSEPQDGAESDSRVTPEASSRAFSEEASEPANDSSVSTPVPDQDRRGIPLPDGPNKRIKLD